MPDSRKPLLRSLGPAFITASVVIGPGSIVTASKVGASFGSQAAWLLVVTTALMIAMTGLSARLGIALKRSLCEEVAHRAGRPLAVAIGVSVFVVVACFQFGNNVGIATSLESLGTEPGHTVSPGVRSIATLSVVAINVGLVVFLFGLRKVYRWVERGMMALVAMMLVAFLTNLLFVGAAKLTRSSDDTAVAADSSARGPAAEQSETRPMSLSLPADLLPRRVPGAGVVDPLGPLVALLGTTFSVAGAFFQAYLVRQKGWGPDQLREGMVDTVAGIGVLNFITLVILLTSAIVLPGADIRDAGSIASQLAPLYGSAAQVLFCLGLLAASLSSLLVNAAIGGSLLADGLGLGGNLDERWPKRFTVVALATGLGVALLMRQGEGFNAVRLILLAQATTVAAWPLLAGVLIWLAVRPPLPVHLRPARWMWLLVGAGLVLALAVAPRTAYTIHLRLTSDRTSAASPGVAQPGEGETVLRSSGPTTRTGAP